MTSTNPTSLYTMVGPPYRYIPHAVNCQFLHGLRKRRSKGEPGLRTNFNDFNVLLVYPLTLLGGRAGQYRQEVIKSGGIDQEQLMTDS